MLIRCKLGDAVRQVVMGGTLRNNRPDPEQVMKGVQRVYDFTREQPGAPLLCKVEHAADIQRFLNIREGYEPHGDDAVAEAEERFGWSAVPIAAAPAVAAGQPEVKLEMVDDDEPVGDDAHFGEDVGDDEGGEGAEGSEGAEGAGESAAPGPAAGADAAELIGLVPANDADGDDWMAWAAMLPGVTVAPADQKATKESVREFGVNNFGLSFPGNTGVLTMVKAIGEAYRGLNG